VKLPRVDRRRVRGAVYKYHRVTRARLPSDIPEDHPRFIAAWTAEEAKTERPQRIEGPQGTLAGDCAAFLASRATRGLSDGYRRAIVRHVQDIARAYGRAPTRAIEARHIKQDLARLAANPARQRRKAWRMLFAWLDQTGRVETDPTEAVKGPRAPKTNGHTPWTRDEIERFRTHWPVTSAQRLAFELTYWTAARRDDVCRLSRAMIGHDGVLTYRQGKTGNVAYVPMFCALRPYADAVSHAHLLACLDAQRPEMMLIITRAGKPRSGKAFGAWLVAAARKAGIEGRSAHGLRKSRLTQIAEDGGDVHAIQSWGGHRSLAEAQHYISTADRKRSVLGEEQEQNSAQVKPGLHKSR